MDFRSFILILSHFSYFFHFINASYFGLLMNDTNLKNYDAQDLINKLKTELDLHNVHTVSVKPYSVLLPPDTVLELCLKGTPLLKILSSGKSSCKSDELDFKCRLGELAMDEKKSINMAKLNDAINKSKGYNVSTAIFHKKIKDCSEWWNLLLQVNSEADPHDEIGQCLQHTFSVACHKPLYEVIKKALA